MKLYISSCEPVKSGTKNGRAWTLYHVFDPKGNRYTTFEKKYTGFIGQEVEVEVREDRVEKNGKTYLNRTIVEPRREAQEDKGINSKLDHIIDLLESMRDVLRREAQEE